MASLECSCIGPNGVAERWHPAWVPIQTVLKYTFAGIFIGLLLLLPAGIVLERFALFVPLLSLLVGAGIGFLIWFRSYTYVSGTYLETVTDSHKIRRDSGSTSTIYASPLSPENSSSPGPAPVNYTTHVFGI